MFNYIFDACAITGHRLKRLGGSYDSIKATNVRYELESNIMHIIEEYDVRKFYVGGANGVDQMAFDILYKLKEDYDDIEIIVAVPFEEQYILWDKHEIESYFEQLGKADKVVYVDILQDSRFTEDVDAFKVDPGKYHRRKMYFRNLYMVSKASFVIGVWDGSVTSGTGSAIYWANKLKRNVRIINPDMISEY